MMDGKYDETLLGIVKEEGQIIPFLDSVFGFLYRCTDFFRLQNDPGDKLGFPPGVGQQIILKVLQKWETQARLDDENYYKLRNSSAERVPVSVQEEIVESNPSRVPDVGNQPACSGTPNSEKKYDGAKRKNDGDCYNGAVRNGYQWSQTISDLDVQVTVPSFVTKAKQLNVDIDGDRLCVKLNDIPEEYVKENPDTANNPLIDGVLCFKTKKEESTWTLVPGREIQIHLEKCKERWWDALLTNEEKINLQKIDASRAFDDLPEEEQMKIQELMWTDQKKKIDGISPRHQPIADMLKEAWNQEGSPFKGMEYNPSKINFDGNFIRNQDMPS